MFRSVQHLLERLAAPAVDESSAEEVVRLATAVLFVEMVGADFEREPVERDAALAAIVATLALEESSARNLLELAERESAEAVEIFQFTRVVDRAFSPAQKVDLIERLWEIAMADDYVDGQEEYFVRKLASLLHVEHKDFIAAKLRARERRGAGV